MPKRDQHEFDKFADELRTEIDDISGRIAKQLPFAQAGGDAKNLTRAQYLDHVRFNWTNTPGFPQSLLDRHAPPDVSGQRPEVGMKQYLKDVGEAFPFGYPEPPPPVLAPPPQVAPAQSFGAPGMNVGLLATTGGTPAG